ERDRIADRLTLNQPVLGSSPRGLTSKSSSKSERPFHTGAPPRCLALPQKFADRNEAFASDNNPTEGEVGGVQRASRHDLVRALAPRYAHVGKRDKSQIMDQVCEVTGYTRKYALTLLKEPPEERCVKRTRRRSPSYGPAEVELLRLCWL